MCKRRRVELHIEHCRVPIFAGAAAPASRAIDARSSGATSWLEVGHASCPTCGSSRQVKLSDAVTNPRLDLAVLICPLHDGSIPLHRAPSGDWWICTKSLHQR